MTDSTRTIDYSRCVSKADFASVLKTNTARLTQLLAEACAEHKWSEEELTEYMVPHPEFPEVTIYTPRMVELLSKARAYAASNKRVTFADALSILNGKQVSGRTGELGRALEARMDSFEARLSDIEKEMTKNWDVLMLILTTLNQRLPNPSVVVAQPAPVVAAPVTAVVPARVEPSAWGDTGGDHHQ